jgi:hypothetical protein
LGLSAFLLADDIDKLFFPFGARESCGAGMFGNGSVAVFRRVHGGTGSDGLIVADGFIAGVCGRSDGWLSCRYFSLESCPTPVALDVHLKNGRLLNEAIDGGLCHGGTRKDLAPLGKELVDDDEDEASFVSS